MPHYSENRCGRCGLLTSPELLTIKKVVFAPRTRPQKTVKSRTVVWLCERCLEDDADWNRKAYDSPGHTSPGLERAKVIQNE